MLRKSPLLWLCVFLPLLSAMGEVQTQEITYSDGNTQLVGYLAYDDSLPSQKPGAIVIHEWWGHNDYARKRARMLAEAGYVALALDMFGEGKVATHPKEAGEFASKIGGDLPLAERRFKSAMRVLAERDDVDASRLVTVGYCFGGGTALNMARLGLDLRAVASVHGGLNPGLEVATGQIKAQLLVCHGGDDALIPMTSVEAFKKEMTTAEADYAVNIYPGAKHSFSNPDADGFAEKFGLPLGYQKEADEASWQDILKFFADATR